MSKTLAEQIAALKVERNAVILAHNYQVAEVQDLADFVGDSLELSRMATAVSDKDVVVFCGVYFMAESAAILNPAKTILLPDLEAGCPMADMVTAEQVREMRAKHPGAAVVCYVNSSAAVKAESDCCCTSANAVRVLQSIAPDREIIFVPDQYLGDYAARQAGRTVHLWPGYCPSHMRITVDDVVRVRAEYPDGVVLVHPECSVPVRDAADYLLSTGQMLRHARESAARVFLVGTEVGMLHRLRQENPGKVFVPISERCICPNMKRIRPEKVLWSLLDMQYRIVVPEDIRVRAFRSIQRMLDIGS